MDGAEGRTPWLSILKDLSRSFARHRRAEGKAGRATIIYGQAVTFDSPVAGLRPA